MVKSELIRRVAELNPGLRPEACEAAVDAFVEELAKHLEAHGRIELRGLGSFTVGEPMRGTRVNPRNGMHTDAPSKPRIRFRPSSTLAKRLLSPV